MDTYTIGHVAQRSGFSTSALRFYEKHGLIEPVRRTDAGYRVYDDRSLDRLEFIARAKQLGCTLEEITDLARLWDGDDCGPVQRHLHDLVSEKISGAQARSAELLRFTAQLQTAAARLESEPADGPCGEGCACLSDVSAAGPTIAGEPTVACTLDPDGMTDRIEEWQAVLATVVHRTSLSEGGVRLAFGPDVRLDEVARLMVAEQHCCSFFAFALTVDQRGTALEVRAPTDADDLVTSVFGTAT